MATKQVVVSGRCDLPISPCSEVVVCLDTAWAYRTESGYPLIYGEVTTVNEIQTTINPNCCTNYKFTRTRCNYTVQFDDDQLLDDPETGVPYVLEDDDTESISSEVCIVQALIAGPQV